MQMQPYTRGTIVHLVLATLLLPTSMAGALELEDPANFEVVQIWSGGDIGVPGLLGAMMFSEDGETLYVVGNSEQPGSALYAVAVTRDPETGRVTDLGPAETTTLVFSGTLTGLDAGLELGPDGTLFYTYFPANRIAQRPGGFEGAETTYDMSVVDVPDSVAGLTFSPHIDDPNTGFGQMQVSSWQEDLSAEFRNIYNIPLTSAGGGMFTPGDAVLFVTLPRQGTGALQYVPSGLFEGDLMYLNWDYGEIRVLAIDQATGLPIDADTDEPTLGTTNPVDELFASDLGQGPWGLEFDLRSNDFFVSTWEGDPFNSIIQLSGPGFTNGNGGTGGDGGTGGAGGTPTDDGGGGCGCRVQEPRDGVGTLLLVGMMVVFLLRPRRKRKIRSR
ncbi:MAG: hypothetical protein AMJ62_08835 [Myxococcales bacterium SG8_38]|nr:MAG: hypothetical protein AMJ62_08835 [Myxococcales bacterium SG8_38]